MLRVITAATLVALLATPAAAQTQRQVDEAEARSEDARRSLHDAVDARSDAETHLALALADYESANDELERLVFATTELESRVLAQEARTRELRRRVEKLVVAAYMTGRSDPVAITFDVAPGPERVMVEQVAAAGTTRVEAELGKLGGARAELDELRGRYDDDRARETALRTDIAARAEILEGLLGATDAGVTRALDAVAAADRAYQDALTAYDAEQRRLAALGGVLRWRPLVEQYFPPERVAEALQVMHCESRGNPDARHPGSDASGLFQFLAGTWAFASPRAGFPGASRFDPEANVASAAWLVDYSIRTNHRWGPWGRWTCRNAVPGAR